MWGMLDPNLSRTCASEALGGVSFCSFLEQLPRKLDASPSRSAETFSGSVPKSSRGREGVYFFRPQKPRGRPAPSDAF